MHHYGRFDERALHDHPTYEGHSEGYSEAVLISRASGSVHTGLSIGQLTTGGSVHPHVHSYEESLYILSGEAVVTIDGSSYLFGAGDYAAIKVGTPHAWRASESGPVRWLQMAAPQPKPPGAERDTFFLRDRSIPDEGVRLATADPGGNILGHFDASQIPAVGERTGGGTGLQGVFLKWLLDENIGSRHHRLLFLEYQPGVSIGLHDHTFEEAYFILSGEVDATLDGTTYRATVGDVLWTGVGCVHAFANVSPEPVRWLETFSPQPPKENVFRFMAEWDVRARELEGS